ncbi:mannan endo-1,4-beta-mannosidase-like [Haliotis asinina]|uniref:mannan endo-1,4-beta-mannosidase-like n=1 Tax=Haliotis asinina TaxID=109174 RepID=UPI0035320184
MAWENGLLLCIAYGCLVSSAPVDQHATPETSALYYNLRNLAKDPARIMFGQHKATLSGASGGHAPYRTHTHGAFTSWEFTNTQVHLHGEDELCDVKEVTGQYPALTGFDFYEVTSDWMELVGYLTKKAHARGMIVTMSWHMKNPFSHGNAWNHTGTHILQQMLPGGNLNHGYTQLMDKAAAYLHNLKDDDGKLIPVIFRPFHESNGGWFWWGLGNPVSNTGDDLKHIFQYTVKYFRDVKGVHNVLWAYSPNAGFNSHDLYSSGQYHAYMDGYPGDDYVDILGLDDYLYVSKQENLQKFVDGLGKLVEEAEKRYKIPALTEIGLSKDRLNSNPNWWADYVLASIKGTKHTTKVAAAQRIAFMYTWTNICGVHDCDIYTPYKGHQGDHYFVDFFKDPIMRFADYTKQHNMYRH